MATTGILIFHHGFTDILNSFGLIDYFLNTGLYSSIYLITRDEAKEYVDFFVRERPCVIPKYYPIDFLNGLYSICSKNPVKLMAYLLNIKNYEPLCIGYPDIFNSNPLYKNKFAKHLQTSPLINGASNFVKSFYEAYNIDYNLRITNFSFTRQHDEEEAVYNKFIEKYGKRYILTHHIDKIENKENLPIVELDRISHKFFDFIKVLQNSEELHLLDSVWGAFVYLLDCKYNLFENKKIHIHCKRSYFYMYLEPIQKSNFILVP